MRLLMAGPLEVLLVVAIAFSFVLSRRPEPDDRTTRLAKPKHGGPPACANCPDIVSSVKDIAGSGAHEGGPRPPELSAAQPSAPDLPQPAELSAQRLAGEVLTAVSAV